MFATGFYSTKQDSSTSGYSIIQDLIDANNNYNLAISSNIGTWQKNKSSERVPFKKSRTSLKGELV